MFESKEDLYDFLLTSDFNEKYSDIEYKYFLLGFKDLLRRMHSESSGLKTKVHDLKTKLELTETELYNLKHQIKFNSIYINNLKDKLQECKKPWYKKLLNK